MAADTAAAPATPAAPAAKARYVLLDALRGVAALCVIVYHFFEAWATSPVDQHFNHGYLAVDFFFILSGFVMSYAYDDRWDRMSVGQFFRKRLIRLHPMVVFGVLLGLVTYIIQGCEKWDGTHVGISAIMLAVLLNLFMLPAIPGTAADVRGNNEMFPLNGPNWSLFFEYIGNILYALAIRKMSTRALKWLVVVLGVLLGIFAIGNWSGAGHIGVGWSLTEWNFPGGLLRMAFSYSMGMLIARTFRPGKAKWAFPLCSLSLIALMTVPHVGGEGALWMNGVFDMLCVAVFFPVILYIGACGSTSTKAGQGICSFLGDISYPVYIIQYPLMYLYYSYIWKHGLSIRQSVPLMAAVFVGSIVLAWLAQRFWEKPIRRRLTGNKGFPISSGT